MEKAQILGDMPVLCKCLRGDELTDWVVLRGGTKILTDGQDIAARLSKVSHNGLQLTVPLAQADHDT